MRVPKFRLRGFTYAAAFLLALIFFLSPAQLPVVLHKLSLVTLAAVLGYWLDRHIFPEARPSEIAGDEVGMVVGAWHRRVALVVGTMISLALAL